MQENSLWMIPCAVNRSSNVPHPCVQRIESQGIRQIRKSEAMLHQISIIVPVYNVENYIGECLESILRQTYGAFEAILVDDGSTDASGRICDEWACQDSRFRTIHTANQGVGTARNAGLAHAKGEYCFFLDSDDLIEADALAHLLHLLRSSEADIALGVAEHFSGTVPERGKGEMVCIYRGLDEICQGIVFDKGDLKPLARKSEKPKIHWEFFSGLYRMELVREHGLKFLTISHGEDTYFCFSCLLVSKVVVTTDQTVYWHRRNPSSVTYQYHEDYLGQTRIYDSEYRRLFAKRAPTYMKRALQGMDAQYFCRCVSAVERELAYSPGIRSLRMIHLTLREIRRDKRFSVMLSQNNIRYIQLASTRRILCVLKLRLAFPLSVLFVLRAHLRDRRHSTDRIAALSDIPIETKKK